MPSILNFTGSGFTLQSVTLEALGTLRVRFTQDVKLVSPANADDGLNPANYTLSGPGPYGIQSAGAVYLDPQSVDLYLSGVLAAGQWTLTVAATLETAEGDVISAPLSMSFWVEAVAIPESESGGAEDFTASDVLRQHLNPYLAGQGWDAVIAGLATGDDWNWENGRRAFDQLFTISASGQYLTRRASDSGIDRPTSIGMPDELFRSYAIKLANGKLTENSLLDILSVFYGDESLRAHIDSVPGPFNIGDQTYLRVLLDEQDDVTITFETDDFAIPGVADAAEVAAAITRAFEEFGSSAFALAVADPETGESVVSIYSAALGLGSSVRVLGGNAQNVLLFSDHLDIYESVPVPTWVIVPDAITDRTRFTLSNTALNPDLSQVQAGDYVNVFGQEFLSDNRGTFDIVDLSYSYSGGLPVAWFEVSGQLASQTIAELVPGTSVMFFRPSKQTNQLVGTRAVSVACTRAGVDIRIPATSQAVGREEYAAAYLNSRTPLSIASSYKLDSEQVVVTTASHGLSVGDWVFLDSIEPDTSIPATIPGNHDSSTPPTSGDSSPLSVWGPVYDSNAVPAGDPPYLGPLCAAISNDRAVYGPDGGFGVIRLSNIVDEADGSTSFEYRDVYTAEGSLAADFAAAAASTGTVAAWYLDKVLVTGGAGTFGTAAASSNTALLTVHATTDVITYDAATPPNLNTARVWHEQLTLSSANSGVDGGFLVLGGFTAGTTATASVERWAPTDGASWLAATSMTTARARFSAVQLDDGRVLVAGGLNGVLAIQSCEIFDPLANTWAATGPMAYARYGHKAVLLPSGKVLVIGGKGCIPSQSTTPVALKYVEIFDPATGRWSPGGKTAVARDFPAVAHLSSRGQIVVSGGSDTAGSTVTELLDTATLKWSLAPKAVPVALQGQATAVLDSGIVVAVGGANPAGTARAADEVRYVYAPGADAVSGTGFNQFAQVTEIVSGTSFKVATDSKYGLAVAATGTVLPVGAAAADIAGPYLWSPTEGVTITGTDTTLTTAVSAGAQYGLLTVGDTSEFPDEEGWIMLAFGYDYAVGPFRYYGVASSTSLIIDYGFMMTDNVPAGSSVTLLSGKGPANPANANELGSFYLTDSPAGRAVAQSAIEGAVASGNDVDIEIVYPGDRGVGGEGLPGFGANRLSDKVAVWAGPDQDTEIQTAREDV